MTGIGGVEALRGGWTIESEGAGSGSRGTSVVLEVRVRVQGASEIGVGAGELLVLSCWLASNALQFTTLISGKLNLLVNCRFASAPDCQLNSPFEVKISLVWGLGCVCVCVQSYAVVTHVIPPRQL